MQLWGLHLLNLLKLCHAQSPKALRNKHQHVRGFTALTWNWTRHHRKERNSRVTASTQYFPGVKETSIYQHMILPVLGTNRTNCTNCTWEKESNKRIEIFAIRRLNIAGCQVATGVLLRAEGLCDVTLSRMLNTYRSFEAPTAWH